jgi:predicted RNA binding protein YcfA (HicA-like mRNA interferase family)
MARDEKIFEQILDARGSIAFRDLERVLRKLGFELARTRGSHHIYRHPKVPRHLNIQPVGGEAKLYQIKQLRDMIEEFNLKIQD